MTDDQIQICKNKLLQLQVEQKKAETSATSFTASSEEILDQAHKGRVSRKDAMQSQQVALEALRRREMLAEKIEGGLRRISMGSFGHCFYCEEEIPFPRLEEDPTNTCCVKCVQADI